MSEEIKQPEIQDEMKEEFQETEETQEEQIQEEPQEEQSTETEEPEKKPKKSIDDRIAELKKQTWEAREAQRQAKAEREAIEAERAKIEEMQQKALKKPDPDQYDDHDKYLADSENYHAQKAAFDARKLAQQELEKRRQEEEQYKIQREWEFKKQQASEKDPNFMINEHKVDNVFRTYRTHPIVAQEIIGSDMSTELVTFLGNNIETTERLANLPPQRALKELGKLEARLSVKPKKTITPTPRPVDGLEGGKSASRDLSKLSSAEYEAEMNKKQFGY